MKEQLEKGMEDSTYVPNSIPPSLVVFSHAATGYGDPIRMQRPFISQVSEGKELNLSPSGGGAFGMSGSPYGGLSAGLAAHLQGHPFHLHPALDPTRLPPPFGSGAFRPLGSPASSTNAISPSSEKSSAFTPHQQHQQQIHHHHNNHHQHPHHHNNNNNNNNSGRRKLEAIFSGQVEAKNYANGRQRSTSPSTQTRKSVSPGSRDEDRDEDSNNHSPKSDRTDTPSPDDHMPTNNKRRRKGGPSSGLEIACPVCKVCLRPLELEPHLLMEVEQLMVMSRLRRQLREDGQPGASSPNINNPPTGKKDSHSSPTENSDSRWDTYHRVRSNRHSRLRLKSRRRREESGGPSLCGPHVSCPVCQAPIHGSSEQISSHVESCLRKQNGEILDEDEPVDIEGDCDNESRDVEDSYDWMSRKHNRNYPGTAINMTTSSRRRGTIEEENDSLEVVVDGDDTSTYGQAQYTEADIQAFSPPKCGPMNNNKEQNVINSSETQDESNPGETLGQGSPKEEEKEPETPSPSEMSVSALRNRIKELEKIVKNGGGTYDVTNCFLCKEKYKKPVVSISCWHVFCESCWLKTLKSKKLCPQCNMITSPSDLRRIFLKSEESHAIP